MVRKFNGLDFFDGEVVLSESAKRYHSPELIARPYEGNAVDLTVFVSCYNESKLIVNTLNTLREALKVAGHSYEIIVIDDVSKDDSRDKVRAYIAEHPDMNIVLRCNAKNKGFAQNYFDAAFIGRGKYMRLVCGDNSEPVESQIKVFSAIGQADIIIPYYVTSEGKAWYRMLISNTYTGVINLITGYRLHYYNGLAVHLRYNVLRWHSNTHGFGFQADLLTQLLDLGFTYKEVPIIMVEKREGRSNAITVKNMLSVSHSISEIIIRRISHRLYRR
uniref:DPM-DPG synthase-like protein n=1 Tax=uncultured bacterium CSL1 TaxID=1091565 RepID=G4WVB7_9BACT|nr:DPM-DPG synthase-like protein [uncultured bacterium CSL1]